MIGSKSGLSTGVESYQMISRYNGKEYQFDIYNDRYFSTVPAKNTETFEDNPYEVWRSKRYKEDGTVEEFDNHIHYFFLQKLFYQYGFRRFLFYNCHEKYYFLYH